jgi:hypothetical protein
MKKPPYSCDSNGGFFMRFRDFTGNYWPTFVADWKT